MKVDLGREISTKELMAAIKKAAEDSGVEFNPNQCSHGGQEVIVLGSAREEMRGEITTFRPVVKIPLAGASRFFQAMHVVLSFEDMGPHVVGRGRYPSWALLENKSCRIVNMNISLAGKKTLFNKILSSLAWVPVAGWALGPYLGEERTEYFFPKRLRGDIKAAYMNYLSQVGDAINGAVA